MLKKILMGAGMAYLARKFMGGRRTSADYPNRGPSRFGLGRRGW
jgi:hypothetical protein